MKNQITIPQTRDAMKMTRDLIPILNQTEYNQLHIFFSNVLDRYTKEEYPDGLPEDLENN